MNKRLIIILVCFMSLSCRAQGGRKAPVAIEDVKSSYLLNEPVTFTVTNRSDSTIFYGIGVEMFLNGEWREYISDIEANHYQTPFAYKELGSQQKKQYIWPYDPKLRYLQPEAGKNRLFVFYASDGNGNVKDTNKAPRVYSREMIFK